MLNHLLSFRYVDYIQPQNTVSYGKRTNEWNNLILFPIFTKVLPQIQYKAY
jgi:hypothetical protein